MASSRWPGPTNGVRAEKTLTNGLTIVKDFQLSSNYLVMATVRLENRSAQPLALPAQEWVVGTAAPLGPRDKGQAVGVLWYNGAKTEDLGGSSYFSGGCRQPVPPLEYRGGASNVVWVAAHNQFFALAAMPQQPAQGLVIRRINLPRPTGEEAQLVATNAPTPARLRRGDGLSRPDARAEPRPSSARSPCTPGRRNTRPSRALASSSTTTSTW